MLQMCYKCYVFATKAFPFFGFATLCYTYATTIYKLNSLIINDAHNATVAT